MACRRPDRREGRGAEGQGRGIQELGCCTRASFEGSIPLLVGGARRRRPGVDGNQHFGSDNVEMEPLSSSSHPPQSPSTRPVEEEPDRRLACFPTHVSRSGIVPAVDVRYFNNNNQPTDRPTNQPVTVARRVVYLNLCNLSLSFSHATVTQQRPCRWYSRAPPEGVRAGRSGRIVRSIDSTRFGCPDKPEPGRGLSWDFDAAGSRRIPVSGFDFGGGSSSVDGEKRGTQITTTTATFGVARRDGCGGSGQHEHWTWRPVGMRGGEGQQREQTNESAGELSISYRRMLVMPTAS
jgi:hypothetical protein